MNARFAREAQVQSQPRELFDKEGNALWRFNVERSSNYFEIRLTRIWKGDKEFRCSRFRDGLIEFSVEQERRVNESKEML